MAAERYTPDIIARAEQLISRVQGISSCRISTDETGEITEVHVVATAQKSPKLVSRDVETLLRAELGIRVDYKKIGVVLVEADTTEAPPMINAADEPVPIIELPVEEYPARFAFQSVNLFLSQESIQAEVELVRQNVETFGRSRSDNPATPPMRVVAEATLKAVAELLDENIRLCLADIVEVPVDDGEAIVVKVNLVRNRDTKSLAGCSLYSGNVNQTVVFATLDAVNRVMGKLKTKNSVEYKIK